ncbi:MAG: TnsA endonuclease N-terminal domain-containing protein [Nitrosomonadales bacterium]|nr:TnsA endonuclease N-terminal domain-containing protein [Nitrosomonadales bacterium]
MPVRKVVTPSGRGIRGYEPSKKMGRMIAWESPVEKDAILLFEFSPGVVEFREQPEKIQYYVAGEQFTYFPDFEVVLTHGEIIHVEVKPASKLKKRALKNRLEQIAQHYAQKERPFRILTDEEIRAEPRLSNLKLLSYHQRESDPDGSKLSEWVEQFLILPAKTIAGATAVLGDVAKVYRLLAAGFLRCDLSKPISPDSIISFMRKGEENAALLF